MAPGKLERTDSSALLQPVGTGLPLGGAGQALAWGGHTILGGLKLGDWSKVGWFVLNIA